MQDHLKDFVRSLKETPNRETSSELTQGGLHLDLLQGEKGSQREVVV